MDRLCPSVYRRTALRLLAGLYFLGMLTWSNGCAWLIQPPADEPAARQRVETLLDLNAGLDRYKGLARAQLQSPGQSVSGRIALAAAAPDRMRVEWLSALGQPITSLAGNGDTITILSHADRKIYHLPQLRTALERMVKIPIGIEDLLTIMSGRPPLPPYAAVQADPDDSGAYHVLLKNRWRGIVAKLHIDATTGRIQDMTSYDGTGNQRYSIRWRRWMVREGYDIPKQVVIESPDRHALTLDVDRFWPNADVAPEMFELSLTDGDR